MKLIISAAIALGILGVALIGSAPAQAANCTQVSSFSAKFFNFAPPYTLSLGANVKYGTPVQTWTFERSDDGGATYNIVQSSTATKWADSLSPIQVTAGTLVRATAPGCTFVYNPNEALMWEMRVFYGPF